MRRYGMGFTMTGKENQFFSLICAADIMDRAVKGVHVMLFGVFQHLDIADARTADDGN